VTFQIGHLAKSTASGRLIGHRLRDSDGHFTVIGGPPHDGRPKFK
jgi:hypothetical protein